MPCIHGKGNNCKDFINYTDTRLQVNIATCNTILYTFTATIINMHAGLMHVWIINHSIYVEMWWSKIFRVMTN